MINRIDCNLSYIKMFTDLIFIKIKRKYYSVIFDIDPYVIFVGGSWHMFGIKICSGIIFNRIRNKYVNREN